MTRAGDSFCKVTCGSGDEKHLLSTSSFGIHLMSAAVPLPSIAHRARIASLISPLKRVRPKTPFYKLSAHRVPTLWSLYRGLLGHAPGENVSRFVFEDAGPSEYLQIRFRVRALFRQNQHVVKAHAAKALLMIGYKVRLLLP